MTTKEEIDSFFVEWQKALVETDLAIKEKRVGDILREHVMLQGINQGGNAVTRKGWKHLEAAAQMLLASMKLTQKVTIDSAINAIVKAHFDRLPKAKKTGKLSEHAVEQCARKFIADLPRASGVYVYPLVFAPAAKNSDLTVGPVRILSKSKLLAEFKVPLDEEKGSTDRQIRADLYNDWEKHIEAYDHFALVTVLDHEKTLADDVGRDAADLLLNLIRMLFRHGHTDDIRIGSGFIFETQRSSLHFDSKGRAMFTSSRGPFGTTLDDTWLQLFVDHMGAVLPLFGSYLQWFVSGNDPADPVIERVRYASALIGEAYSEPHDHIRIVRLVSALEALALAAGEDKAHNIALTCSYIGSDGDAAQACEMYDAIRAAYFVRNGVVHGDRPDPDDIRRAFYRLEKHVLSIFIGFVIYYRDIRTAYKPPHVKTLRRLVKEHASDYFWDPSLAFP
jgi:hypothetical protein